MILNLIVARPCKSIGEHQASNRSDPHAAKQPKGHDETRVTFKTGGAGNFDICQSAEQPGNASAHRSERHSQESKSKPARH